MEKWIWVFSVIEKKLVEEAVGKLGEKEEWRRRKPAFGQGEICY